jgi:hypothetical protein
MIPKDRGEGVYSSLYECLPFSELSTRNFSSSYRDFFRRRMPTLISQPIRIQAAGNKPAS